MSERQTERKGERGKDLFNIWCKDVNSSAGLKSEMTLFLQLRWKWKWTELCAGQLEKPFKTAASVKTSFQATRLNDCFTWVTTICLEAVLHQHFHNFTVNWLYLSKWPKMKLNHLKKTRRLIRLFGYSLKSELSPHLTKRGRGVLKVLWENFYFNIYYFMTTRQLRLPRRFDAKASEQLL